MIDFRSAPSDVIDQLTSLPVNININIAASHAISISFQKNSEPIYIRSAPSDVIDQLTSLPVTVNRHHWCLTRENFTKLVFVIHKTDDNDNDKDKDKHNHKGNDNEKGNYGKHTLQVSYPRKLYKVGNIVIDKILDDKDNHKSWPGLAWMPFGQFCPRTQIRMAFALFLLWRQKIIHSMPFRYC